MMQSAGVRPNYHARTALASTLGPSWPEVPSRDPDGDWSDEELEEEEQLEPYQQIEYQKLKTQRLVPKEGERKGERERPTGHLPPPLKSSHTRPPGGAFPPSSPLPPLPLRHPSEKPRYATDGDERRLEGLGMFGSLTDALVARLCSYADRHSLLKLTSTSRIMYQVGNWDSRVWKSQALRRWCGDFIFRVNWKLSTFFSHKGSDLPPPALVQLMLAQRTMPPALPAPIPDYAKPVVVTLPPPPQSSDDDDDDAAAAAHIDNPYAALHMMASQISQNQGKDATTNNKESNCESNPQTNHQTSSDPLLSWIKIPGFYSEPMYKEWYLSQVDLDGWYFDSGHVPRVRASELTLEAFRERFLKPGQPCVITDVVPTWPAMAKWHPDTLMDSYCETLIKINEYNDDDLRIKMTMRDFLIYMRENQDARPLYVFDSSFQRRAPTLLTDYGIPQYFWEDLFAALDDEHRPAFRWFLFGSARTGSPFHQDPNGTSAWNAVTHGHKRWALYPPYLHAPPGAYPNGHNPNSLKWWTLIYPQLPQELKPIEFVQGPGDLIFIPSGWWHAVLNLDETLSVTQNFVNLENLDAVVHSLFTSDMHGVMNYWRQRLMSLRPELYTYIGNRIAYEASIVQQDQINELQQDLHSQQASFEKRESELLAEIKRLEALSSDSSTPSKKPISAASFTAQLVSQQRKAKKSAASHY